MTRKIDAKIVSYSVVKPEEAAANISPANLSIAPPNTSPPTPTVMNEKIGRPDVLVGRTYKIEKSPASDHALYVTINDIVLDVGTDHEVRRPFEIFINSKNMEQFQWVVAITRILSAVFRKGGDVTFIVEEMKAVFAPHGGYFRPGGYVPSLVAEIGQVVEKHFQDIGLLEQPQLSPEVQALIASKKAAVSMPPSSALAVQETSQESSGSFPPNATLCNKCHQKSVVVLDGCATCLNCGNSKCG